MTGEIPQTQALAEASPDSISYLLSKDPFELTRKDRDQAVLALREQRKRWEAAEAAGEHSRPRKGAKVADAAKSLITSASSDDLGL